MSDIHIELNPEWKADTLSAILEEIRSRSDVMGVSAMNSARQCRSYIVEVAAGADADGLADMLRSLPGIRKAAVVALIGSHDDKSSPGDRLKIDPRAATAFDHRATELASRFERVIRRPGDPNHFRPELPFASVVTPIGNVRYSMADFRGHELERSFVHDREELALRGDAHVQFRALCERLHTTPSVRRHVGLKLITNLVFDWLCDARRGAESKSLVEHVFEELEPQIRQYEVWVPIFGLFVEHPFPIGPVTIQTVPTSLFDDGRSHARSAHYRNLNEVLTMLDHEERDLLGKAAGVVHVTAESFRAFEVAYDQVETALTLLRFFSMANLVPEAVSYCLPLGRENVDSYRYLIRDGHHLASGSGLRSDGSVYWTIDAEMIHHMRMGCLDGLSRLWTAERRSRFESDLLDAILLYLRHTTAKSLSDKVLFMFTALDSFLLKDDSENIQQNLGQRLAMIAADTVEERRKVVAVVKKAYKLRSDAVHHARSVPADGVETLTKFLYAVYIFFSRLVGSCSQWVTREQFIEDIEARMLSG